MLSRVQLVTVIRELKKGPNLVVTPAVGNSKIELDKAISKIDLDRAVLDVSFSSPDVLYLRVGDGAASIGRLFPVRELPQRVVKNVTELLHAKNSEEAATLLLPRGFPL
jgi:hypothetical protein